MFPFVRDFNGWLAALGGGTGPLGRDCAFVCVLQVNMMFPFDRDFDGWFTVLDGGTEIVYLFIRYNKSFSLNVYCR